MTVHLQGSPTRDQEVIDWLLDADPALRWQVMRDLSVTSPEEIVAERARVATEGLGAELLALQAADGTWAGSAWNRGWDSTMHALMLLRDLGLDPGGDAARRTLSLVGEQVTWWDEGPGDDYRFFGGEVEPCINGQVAAVGAYFGQDVEGIVERLLGEQLGDGGWNCEAENGSTRSSFNTTICVLEALLAWEQRQQETSQVTDARLRGQEYLLERGLFRRLSTGEAITRDHKGDHDWRCFAFPAWWHYDILRGLDYLRSTGMAPDDRAAEAVGLVRSKRGPDGRWLLDTSHPGTMPVDLGETVGGAQSVEHPAGTASTRLGRS